MRRWVGVAVALVTIGCGDNAGPDPGDGGDADAGDTGASMDTPARVTRAMRAMRVTPGGSDASSDGIDGRLSVHTAQTANPPPGDPVNFSSVMVFVGDGSQFIADTDENGSVTFEDPRRGNFRTRHRIRVPGATGAPAVDARPHIVGDRASLVDGAHGRQNRGGRRRRNAALHAPKPT